MNGKLSIGLVVVLLIGVATATVGLFVFPYSPDAPPAVNDSGATQSGVQEVVDANNEFAFDIYSKLDEGEDGNVFYSPYSISSAIAMTYEGAKGQTAEEIKSVFHFPGVEILRPNFGAIYNEINKADKGYELKTGNALWVQQDYPFLEDYKERIEKHYGGKAANLDFVGETELSRETINSFIEDQTNNKIKDLLSKGVVSPDTRMVLTNAIYFKGTWEWEFDKGDTRDGNFIIGKDDFFEVQMMHMDPDKARFNYSDLEKMQILELPYRGGDVSMLIILPKQGYDYDLETGERIESYYTLEDIELSSGKLEEYKSQMRETKLDSISLPKFEFDSKYSMGKTLSALGMPTAFTSSADFSGMDGTGNLAINDVIHQAYVKVDEKGTEAAAATGIFMDVTSAMPRNFFRADHPFVFLIQERKTGNILFMGRVTDPRI